MRLDEIDNGVSAFNRLLAKNPIIVRVVVQEDVAWGHG